MKPEDATRLCIEALRGEEVRTGAQDIWEPSIRSVADALESGDLRIVQKEHAECYCDQPEEPHVTTNTNTAYGKCKHGNIMEFVYPGTWAVIADPNHAYAVGLLMAQRARLAALERLHRRVLTNDPDLYARELAELDALDKV